MVPFIRTQAMIRSVFLATNETSSSSMVVSFPKLEPMRTVGGVYHVLSSNRDYRKDPAEPITRYGRSNSALTPLSERHLSTALGDQRRAVGFCSDRFNNSVLALCFLAVNEQLTRPLFC